MADVDSNLLIAMIAVSVAVAGTVITGLQTRESNKITRESNSLVRKEMNAKLRPWIKLEGLKPAFAIYDDLGVQHWEYAVNHPENKPKKVRVEATLSNIGETPCHIVSRMIKQGSKIERDILSAHEIKKNQQVILMPNASIPKHLDIEYDEWVNKERQIIFIGLGVIFTINDDLEGRIGRVWHLFQGGTIIDDDWYEEKERID